MPALDAVVTQKIHELEQRLLRRSPQETERGGGVRVRRGGREFISFSCNDYLGLTHRPEVIEAGVGALQRYGAGAGASRLVTGNLPLYAALEQMLAALKGTEAACVFGSGYLANLGVIPALVGKDDLIVADKYVHACMIDGALLSGAKLLRFGHNDAGHARRILSQQRGNHRHCLLLTETVFSMDGDCAPIPELAALAEEHNAWLMTDDAHGLGVVPPQRAHVHVQMGTLSKAVGACGGYVCASRAVIEYLKSTARSFVYSTALPPSVVASAIAALELISSDGDLTRRPLQKARHFTSLLGLPEAQSAVVPLLMGESEQALAASRLLEQEGFLVTAIRPPTVPEHTARLRFAFTAQHEDDDIARMAEIVRREGWRDV